MGLLDPVVVVPVFGYTHLLERLYERLSQALAAWPGHHILLVEDGGTEESWSRVCQMVRRHSRLSGMRLAPSSGQHMCILAGLSHYQGRWVVVMDGDLQDPPEWVPKLIAEASDGIQIVMTARAQTGQRPWRDYLGRLYMALLLKQWNPPRYSCFSLLSPQATRHYCAHRLRGRFFVPLLLECPGKKTLLYYRRSQVETSSYSLKRLLTLALSRLYLRYTPLSVNLPSIKILEVLE